MKVEKSITRIVVGYNKIPDEGGDQMMVVQYELKPLDLQFLQKLFNIAPNDPDPVNRNVVYCYDINSDQAKALQPDVIDGVIDLNKYDFMLDCYEGEK